MEFYLLAIKYYIGYKKNVRRFRYFNSTSEELITHYVTPYNNNLPFLISGKKVMSSQIEQFLIFSSPYPINPDTILSTGTRIGEEKHDVLVNSIRKGELNLTEVTSEFLHPEENKKSKSGINSKDQ